MPVPVPVYHHAPGMNRPLLTSLVAYWTLNEASGNRLDSVGASHLGPNGTPLPGNAAGKLGNAVALASASSQYLSVADNAALSTGDIDFTLAAWVFITDNSASKGLVGKTDGAADEYVIYYRAAPTDRFRFAVKANAATVDCDALGAPSLSTWYYIVAWHDSVANTINIQVNNGTVNSAAYAGGLTDTAAAFVVGEYAGGYPLDGRVDSVALWKRVLTAAERTLLYNGGNGLGYPF